VRERVNIYVYTVYTVYTVYVRLIDS
jgi:hypothetical protein